MKPHFLLAAASLALASCATVDTAPQVSTDDLAMEYLAVQLAIGEKDDGYVDAYYGPEELAEQAEAEAATTTIPQLQARVNALDAALAGLSTVPGSVDAERVDTLRVLLGAAKVRLRMLNGERIPFVEEAEGLFGVQVDLPELSTFDPILAELEDIVPGEGPLGPRIGALVSQFQVPDDRTRAVIDAAVEECRRRTLEHIAMPEGERFSLELVNDKPWGGFNYYQGDYHSVIEINMDAGISLSRATDVGCHEAYPGHHVYSTVLERDRVNELGQIEYTLMPLYSPRAIIAEGSAEYGVKLAFPGDTQLAFERDVLAPIAGIDASRIEEYYALTEATAALRPAYFTIAAGYLDGTMEREEVIRNLMRYRLTSRQGAEGSLRFLDTYRSYIVNYGLGEQLVGDYVERGNADMETRWERFIGILNTPTLPEDLM